MKLTKFEGMQIPFHSVKVPSVFSHLVSQVAAAILCKQRGPDGRFFLAQGFHCGFYVSFFGFLGF